MIIYLLKSSICLALLLAIYHFFLEKEKMHQFNRFYLLGSILFSLYAPSLTIYIEPTEITQVIEPLFTTVHEKKFPLINNFDANEFPQEKNIDYTFYFLLLYAIISCLLLIRFSNNLFKLYRKIKVNTKISYRNAMVVLISEKIIPHTFLHYIFINKKEFNKNTVEDELFTHELTHVSQKHTIDILLIELLHIICWFNPLIIYLKKAIKLNHEFLADDSVINSHKNTTNYQHLLLSKVAQNNNSYLASNFNYSLTKKRLIMMTKQSSQLRMFLKKITIVPILIGLLFLFATRIEAQIEAKNHSKIPPPPPPKTIKNLFKDSYELSLVKKAPIFPKCEISNSEFKRRMCLSEGITRIFKENFNFKLAKKLKQNKGKTYISTTFMINKNGSVTYIYGFPYKSEFQNELKEELIRVLNLIPKLKPGIRKGIPVNVRYSFALKFIDNEFKTKTEGSYWKPL